jgi:hypothetical protein
LKAFRFSLERVLEWRRTSLTLEEGKLENLRAEVEALLREREELWRRIAALGAEAVEGKSLRAGDLIALERFRLRLLREVEVMTERIKERQAAAAAQAVVVTEARRRVRLVDRLKGRRYEDWKLEADREMETLAGEFAVRQWRAGPGQRK